MFAYTITNMVNGKKYVGISRHPRARWKAHCWEALNAPVTVINKAIAKHGPDNFSFEIIACAASYDDLYAVEIALIQQYDTYSSKGYNMTRGGEGVAGHIPSEASRAKRRAKMLGRVLTEAHRAKIRASNKGLKRSEEAKKRMSAARRGKPSGRLGTKASEATREKLRIAHAGFRHSEASKQKMTGRVRPDLVKDKISASLKGHVVTQETRAKISAANKGQVPWIKGVGHSAETVEKIRLRMLGNVLSPETRAKLSVSLKGRKYGPRSDEIKAKIAATVLARGPVIVSEETRAKMRAARFAFIARQGSKQQMELPLP